MSPLPSPLSVRSRYVAAGCFLALAMLCIATREATASIKIVSNPAESTSGIGSFTAWLTLTPVNSGEATLQIDITNESAPANGGYITGFVFNNPGDIIDSVALTTAPAPFQLMGAANFDNTISGSPFLNFDIGAGLNATNFLGGGSPNAGLGVGSSGSFIFKLTGTDLSGLTEQSFVSELSQGNGNPAHAKFFVTRFRGFNNGGSEKSVGGLYDDPGSVPEPTTLLIWLGLGAAGLFRFRRKSN